MRLMVDAEVKVLKVKLLQKIIYSNNGTELARTDYVANFVYVNNVINHAMMSEGRYVFTSATVFYPEFAITDHLGNVRVTYTNVNNVATLKQSFSYYPYGMCRNETVTTPNNPNEYLYQGKEYDEEHGLNYYNFHARMYDPALGCWHVPDPMHQYVSGYVAMGDNPVNRIDPDGRTDFGSELRKSAELAAWIAGSEQFEQDHYASYMEWMRYRNAVQSLNASILLGEISISTDAETGGYQLQMVGAMSNEGGAVSVEGGDGDKKGNKNKSNNDNKKAEEAVSGVGGVLTLLQQAAKGEINSISKAFGYGGTGFAIVSTIYAFIDFYSTDRSYGDMANLGVNILSTSMTASGNGYAVIAGAAIYLLNENKCFDNAYEYLDELDNYGGYVVIGSTMVYIPARKKQ